MAFCPLFVTFIKDIRFKLDNGLRQKTTLNALLKHCRKFIKIIKYNVVTTFQTCIMSLKISCVSSGNAGWQNYDILGRKLLLPHIMLNALWYVFSDSS